MDVRDRIAKIGKVINYGNLKKLGRAVRVREAGSVRAAGSATRSGARRLAHAARTGARAVGRTVSELTAKKEYSGFSDIPGGFASGEVTEGCLVLEGGAFRGLYTQGFLDAMMENGINLRCVIGVSAGALGGLNYATGQIGRSARINLKFRHDSRYVGAKALIRSHSILDVGFLTGEADRYEPLLLDRIGSGGRRFVAVATNCLTGGTEYFEYGKCRDILLASRASATMPFISPEVMIDGTPYFDGGCSCCIPYEWALGQGYEKIIVIRTREPEYRSGEKKYSLAFRMYRDYPDFAKKLSESSRDFNRQCDEVERLHAEGRLLRCAPSEHVSVGRIEGDLEKLGALYMLGRSDCLSSLGSIREYLGTAPRGE